MNSHSISTPMPASVLPVSRTYVVLVSMAAACGGLVFGYDTAVISGAVEPLRAHFALDPFHLGVLVSSALIGCIGGMFVAGALTDWIGRRKVIAISAVLFMVSAAACYFSRSAEELTWARVIGGIGVAFASLVAPVYIAELAPASIRGGLVLLNQVGILVGMDLSYLVNAWIGHGRDNSWLADAGWRVMLGAVGVPALMYFILSLLIPESPRWLIKQGRHESALGVLRRLHGDQQAETEAKEIIGTVAQEQGGFRELFQAGSRKVILMAIVLAIFQAITGINIIMYYAPTIFMSAGIGTGSALGHSVIIGTVMLFFTVASTQLVDRLGRRPIMLFAAAGMGTSLGLMGLFFADASGSGWKLLVCVLTYVSSFAIGMGGIFFVVISEIFPTRIRGAATSAAVGVLWCGNYVVSLVFPVMLATMKGNSFYVFSLTCFACFAFVWRFVPETKGKTLEEIEHQFYLH
ncbi:MAG TPA: sugar porter family MFS transporter [Lacunisphaera sp.]|nr:sugar porter family MFS transporter [Lacunisphaera sp.]